MLAAMRNAFSFLIMMLCAAPLWADPAWEISAEEWARPRDGHGLSRMAPVAGAVRELIASANGELLIRYPGGEEGVLWAQELRGWLVALGIASDRIETSPGSTRSDAVDLVIRQGGVAAP